MYRPTRVASRNQSKTRQLFINNTTETDDGRTAAVGLHENMAMRMREMEEVHRQMQMKYDREAKEAAQKKKEKEQKKREAWLARQEALIRPGHVLGRGEISEKNLLRDFLEHEDGDTCQPSMNAAEQNGMDQKYRALVQQRIKRERESVELQRRHEQRKEVSSRPQDAVRHGAVTGSGMSAALGSFGRFND